MKIPWLLMTVCNFTHVNLRLSGWLLFNAMKSILHSSYIIGRTCNFPVFLARWWWLFCNRQTCSVGFFLVLAHWNRNPHADMSRHSYFILTSSQPQFIILWLTWTCLLSIHRWGCQAKTNNANKIADKIDPSQQTETIWWKVGSLCYLCKFSLQ